MDNIDASVDWRCRQSKLQWGKIKRWADEAWAACDNTVLGKKFLETYKEEQDRMGDLISETWPGKTWSAADMLGFLSMCSYLVDETQFFALSGRQRRPWKFLGQVLCTHCVRLADKMADGKGEDALGAGTEAGMKAAAILFEENRLQLDKARKAA
jgi:hypothetical protein